MSNSSVFFDPPLSVQRQQWLIRQLGAHNHNVIVEIGCGEGDLLQCLLAPPWWLDASPTWKEAFRGATQLTRHPFLEPASVAPRRIVAVDIDQQALRSLRDAILQRMQVLNADYPQGPPRWYDLQVELLLGSFVDVGVEQIGTAPIDVLLASEVIEHLEESTLQAFTTVVFGRLRPNVVLITTPNYDFNINFDRAGAMNGFPDPTKRTQRVFRHHDHKFEWNTAEWTTWCKDLSVRYGYDLKCNGIGKLQKRGQADGKAADGGVRNDAMFASHAAVFLRQPTTLPLESERKELPNAESTQKYFFHRFQATPPDMSVNQLAIDEEWARQRLNGTEPEKSIDAYGVWMNETMRVACAGRLEVFLPDMTTLSVQDESVRVGLPTPSLSLHEK